MDYLNLAKKRYSVRNYLDKQVEKEKLEKILEAARVAPTAANMQPIRLLVVQQKDSLEKLSKGARLFNAPLAIIVCGRASKAWTRPYDGKNTLDIDASILTDHMMMEATDLGLGSVWICYFKPEIIRQEFQIPDDLEPINILAIGYTNDTPADPDRHQQTRISLSELVSFDTLN